MIRLWSSTSLLTEVSGERGSRLFNRTHGPSSRQCTTLPLLLQHDLMRETRITHINLVSRVQSRRAGQAEVRLPFRYLIDPHLVDLTQSVPRCARCVRGVVPNQRSGRCAAACQGSNEPNDDAGTPRAQIHRSCPLHLAAAKISDSLHDHIDVALYAALHAIRNPAKESSADAAFDARILSTCSSSRFVSLADKDGRRQVVPEKPGQ